MAKTSRTRSNSAATCASIAPFTSITSFDGHKTKLGRSRTTCTGSKPKPVAASRQLANVLNIHPNVPKVETIKVGGKMVHQLTIKLGSEISVQRRTRYRSEKMRELERDVWWK